MILNNCHSNNEIWKDIEGYEGIYQISNYGRIKSFYKNEGKILKNEIRNTYKIIQLTKDKKRKSFQIHRLVAKAFIPNSNNYKIVNHKDFNRENNDVDNLEWCTQKYNVNYSKINMVGKNHIFDKEKYGIYKRNNDKYEVTIKKKYYGSYRTFKEAQKVRNEALNELNITI